MVQHHGVQWVDSHSSTHKEHMLCVVMGIIHEVPAHPDVDRRAHSALVTTHREESRRPVCSVAACTLGHHRAGWWVC